MNPHAKCCCGKDPKDPLDPDLECCSEDAGNWVGGFKCPRPAAAVTEGALAPGCSISLSVMLQDTMEPDNYVSIDSSGNAPRYRATTATNCYQVMVKSDGGSRESSTPSDVAKSALDTLAHSRRNSGTPGATLRAYPDETPTFTYFQLEWDAAGNITSFQIPPTQLYTVPFSAGQDAGTAYSPGAGAISFAPSCLTMASLSATDTVYPFGANTPWTLSISASLAVQHAPCPEVLAAMRAPRQMGEMTPELARILSGGRMA